MFFVVIIVCITIVGIVGIIAYTASYIFTNPDFIKVLKEWKNQERGF